MPPRPRNRAASASKPAAPDRARRHAELVGRRLASELQAALDALMLPARSVRAMARELGIDANICQRVVAASRCQGDPIEGLRRTPGPDGLEQFRRACGRRGVEKSRLEALHAAVFELEQLLAEHGGSLIKLREWLDDTAPKGDDGAAADTLAARRASQRANAKSLGCRLDTHAVAVFMRPSHHKPAAGELPMLEGFSLNIYSGWRARPGSMPLVLATFGGSEADAPARRTTPDRFAKGGFLLDQFTSRPLPLVTERRSAAGTTMQVLDSARRIGEKDAGLQIAMANPLRHVTDPRHERPPRHTSFVRCRYPASELVMDVFLDRELAAACVPTGAVAWGGPWLGEGQAMPWYDRLPGAAAVTVARGDAIDNPCQHCPWYTDAVRSLADEVQWRLNDFVCYRLSVRYPMWGAAHLIGFEFGEVAAD